MLGLLDQILCWIKQFGALVLGAAINAVNAVIAALCALVQGVLDAIPIGVPDPPTFPAPFETAFHWIAWVWPVGATVSAFGFALTVLLLWMAIGTLLRWAKVIS